MVEVADGPASAGRDEERGIAATVDRTTGEVHGAGAGAGGGNAGEDYDDDPTSGSGTQTFENMAKRPHHPLPESPEARHNEIPETQEREKGLGEDGNALLQPDGMPVDPDGNAYRHSDVDR